MIEFLVIDTALNLDYAFWTLPNILLGLTAGSSLYGGYRAGQDAEDAARTSAQSQREAAAARMAMARYNSTMAMRDAENEKELIEFNARRLAEEQVSLQQEQRMNVAARGGVMGGSDLLLILDQAERMQVDQLEMKRQSELVITRAKETAEKFKIVAQYGSDADMASAQATLAAGEAAQTQAYASGITSTVGLFTN